MTVHKINIKMYEIMHEIMNIKSKNNFIVKLKTFKGDAIDEMALSEMQNCSSRVGYCR